MSTTPDEDRPVDEDTLGWDVNRHGRMREYAAPDDAVEVEPYVVPDRPA